MLVNNPTETNSQYEFYQDIVLSQNVGANSLPKHAVRMKQIWCAAFKIPQILFKFYTRLNYTALEKYTILLKIN